MGHVVKGIKFTGTVCKTSLSTLHMDFIGLILMGHVGKWIFSMGHAVKLISLGQSVSNVKRISKCLERWNVKMLSKQALRNKFCLHINQAIVVLNERWKARLWLSLSSLMFGPRPILMRPLPRPVSQSFLNLWAVDRGDLTNMPSGPYCVQRAPRPKNVQLRLEDKYTFWISPKQTEISFFNQRHEETRAAYVRALALSLLGRRGA